MVVPVGLVDVDAAFEKAQDGPADVIHGLAVVFDGLAAHQVVHRSRAIQIGRRRVGSGRHCPIAYQTQCTTP